MAEIAVAGPGPAASRRAMPPRKEGGEDNRESLGGTAQHGSGIIVYTLWSSARRIASEAEPLLPLVPPARLLFIECSAESGSPPMTIMLMRLCVKNCSCHLTAYFFIYMYICALV